MDLSEHIKNYSYYREYPIDSFEYQLALDIEFIIRDLYKNNKINLEDVKILDSYLQGYSNREASLLLNLSRHLISRRIKYIIGLLINKLS